MTLSPRHLIGWLLRTFFSTVLLNRISMETIHESTLLPVVGYVLLHNICIPKKYLYSLFTLGAHARSEGYCSCPVCMCVCVCPLISAASHIGITHRYTNGFTAIQRSFSILLIFLKMLHSKVMALYAYPEQLQRPRAFSPTE